MFASKIAAAMTATALASATLLMGAASADAATSRRCSNTTTEHTVCITNLGHGAVDTIDMYSPNGTHIATTDVVCTGGSGYRWDMTRVKSYAKSDILRFADTWCSDY